MAMIAAIWMSFEQEQACVSNPRRNIGSHIIGFVGVSLKTVGKEKKEYDEYVI